MQRYEIKTESLLFQCEIMQKHFFAGKKSKLLHFAFLFCIFAFEPKILKNKHQIDIIGF